MGRVLIVAMRLAGPFSVAASGCLMLADAPAITDRCIERSIEGMLGESIASASTGTSDNTYDCPDIVSEVPDVVFEWTAPAAGTYAFSAAGAELDLRLGLASAECGGDAFECTAVGEDSLVYRAYDGEVLHVLVELRGYTDGGFVLSIVETEPTPTPGDDSPLQCASTNDGVCDEPGGSGLCPAGTDSEDCACPYVGDGQCDEPDYCRPGTDAVDCGCDWQNDGECDEPEGTGYCPDGSDPLDC